MRTALVIDHRMNLIDDERARRLQHSTAAFTREQNVERLRRGDYDMRRLFYHRRPFFRRRVTRAHQGANLDVFNACRLEILLDAPQWRLQINLNVVAQGLQRRDVHDLRFIAELPVDSLPNEIVNCRQKSSQRLARTRRRRDQRVLALLDGGPGTRLWFSRSRELLKEPIANAGMKRFQGTHQNLQCTMNETP